MAAPFNANGRYEGGISAIVNSMLTHAEYLSENNLEIIKYETCRMKRKEKSQSRFNLKNVLNALSIYFSLTKQVISEKPEILYYHSSIGLALLKDLIAIKRAKRKSGVKIILHIHFANYQKIMTGKKLLDRMILTILKKYVDKIIFLSKTTAEEFISKGICEKKTVVIYNFSTFELNREEKKLAIDLNNEKCNFLFVGSLDKRKGICDLLECFENVQEPFTLHLCGGYNDISIIKTIDDHIKKLGESVIEHGYVSGEEKKNIFLTSDVLILPSYGEGLPMVIMEAFQSGNAIIATNVGAIPEIITQNSGLLVKPGNKDEILDAIKTLIGNRDLLKKMKKYNLEIADKYTLKKFVKDVAIVCKDIID